MRFGGFIFKKWNSAEEWAKLNKAAGYSAVYFPFDYKADLKLVDEYVSAAKAEKLVIAEIGVWNNTLSQDEAMRNAAIEKCIKQLELADYVKAKCCVNISGSCAEQWDGPHKDNLTEKTFDRIVSTSQKIIDAVNPKHTAYTLEPMPWMYPDSTDSYLDLIKQIDRKGFGAHFDPVNLICSPQLYYKNTEFLEDFFKRVGPHIKSCHAKDIILRGNLTVHLDECRPGLGELDFHTFLTCLDKLDSDIPIMLEHMNREEDFVDATKFIGALAGELNISL